MLLQSARIILLDNVTEIASAKLSAALTATTWRGRLLGRSEMVNVPNTALWTATGNNVELSKEMGRRVVPIRLDAGMEHPEDRDDFKHRLPAWAAENRAKLVSACLSLVRAWLDADRPAPSKTLGRYESWARVIGGIVTYAGFDGFLENRGERVAAADRESAEWAALASAWWSAWGIEPVTPGKLLDLASGRGLLLDLYAGRPKLGAMQRLGRALAARRDAVVAEWVIRSAGHDGRTGNAAYRLERRDSGRDRHKTPETPETPDLFTAASGVSAHNTLKTPAETGVSGQNTRQTPGPCREQNGGSTGFSGVSGVSGPPRPESRRSADELLAIMAELGWPGLIVLGQHIGPGEERWRRFCDFPPPWLPAAIEVAKEQRRLAVEYPFS
jgi:hypothetical protein